MKSRTIRISLRDWKILRKNIPAKPDETLASYMNRVTALAIRYKILMEDKLGLFK